LVLALVIDFSFDQQMEAFRRMHRRALEFLGGVPRRIVYDNLKSVVLLRVGATVHVRFTTAADLVNDLVAAQSRSTLHRRLYAWFPTTWSSSTSLAASTSTLAAPTCFTRPSIDATCATAA
jgi:hypothetical protein